MVAAELVVHYGRLAVIGSVGGFVAGYVAATVGTVLKTRREARRILRRLSDVRAARGDTLADYPPRCDAYRSPDGSLGNALRCIRESGHAGQHRSQLNGVSYTWG